MINTSVVYATTSCSHTLHTLYSEEVWHQDIPLHTGNDSYLSHNRGWGISTCEFLLSFFIISSYFMFHILHMITHSITIDKSERQNLSSDFAAH